MLYHSADKIDELKNIDLWESYVLDWHLNDDEFCVKLDAFLLPEHPKYSKPQPNEWACFKVVILKFKKCSNLIGFDKLKDNTPAIDAAGEKDFGHIEDFVFTRVGDYKFVIELAGEISFTSKYLIVVFSSDTGLKY